MKAVIIEDETAASVNLSSVLRKVIPGIEISAVLESIAESIEYFGSQPMPDLVFMDIHLADGEAFRIFEAVQITCPIVFTTAYDQYALEAFKVNSIDYLLKPIKESDISRAVDKLMRLSGTDKLEYGQRVSNMVREHERQKTFLISVRDKIVPLKVEDIAYLYTFNEKVSAYTRDGQVLPMDKSLDKLAKMLPQNDFFRANRQFIISRSAIKDISVWFGSRLSLNLTPAAPEKLVISKDRVPEFKRWLAQYDPL